MKKIFIVLTSSLVLATVFSCGGGTTAEKAVAEKDEDHANENSNTALLTNEQVKSIGIELGRIELKQLTSSLKANGRLQVPNQNKASVNSLYSGVIKSLLVQPGSTVKKGQVIATVANPEFIQVQSDYLSVSAKIGLAELEAKRQRELNAGNAGALKNLQAAETELKTLRTAQSALRQQIQLMGINPATLANGKLVQVLAITAPIGGVISNVIVKIGSYVDVTTPVAEIVDNSQLHLDLFVYEKDLTKLQNNQLIHFTLTNNPGKEYDARIYSLGSSFEGESKAVTVHAKVMGDISGLIDGMNITAVISLDKATVPAVPADAVINHQGSDYIFIVTQTNTADGHIEDAEKPEAIKHNENDRDDVKGLTFEKIPVVKGTTDVGYSEITLLKEVSKDAKVVVKGAFFVLAKMTNTGGHEH